MKKYKTLFLTGRGERHQQAALDAAPPELDVIVRRDASKKEIIALLPEMDFLISERTGVIDAEIMVAGKKLKLIQRLGSQTWDIDIAAAKKVGIPVCFLPVKTCGFVAEHLILMMLGLAKRVRELVAITDKAGDWGMPPKRCNENYFAFNWSGRTKVDALNQGTVGILGFGEIGTELARRLKGFDCRLLYSKRHRLPPSVETELGLTHVSPAALAIQSDFVACLLPNLPENNQSVDAAFFASMKRGAHFAHCGAPGVVNEDDMIASLKAGHIAGAAIDCFTYEPLRPDDPLVAVAREPANNVILTPHIAAGTVAASSDERKGDFVNLMAAINGTELNHRLA